MPDSMLASVRSVSATSTTSTLKPYQGEYRGLVVGEGTEYHIEGAVDGLYSVEMRSGDRAVPRGHGYIRGPDYANARTVVIPLTVVGAPHSFDVHDRLNTIRSTFVPTPEDEHWLSWWPLPYGQTIALSGRVTRLGMTYSAKSAREGVWRSVVQFRAADPFLYSGESYAAVVPIFGIGDSGGFDLPTELPLDLAAAVPIRENIHNVVTVGRRPAIPVLYPGTTLSTVRVDNVTTGASIQIDTAVPQGDTLVADMHSYMRSLPGPHIHIDGSTRFSDWQQPRIPFALAPGDNVMEFTTDGVDVVCLFTWRDVWL